MFKEINILVALPIFRKKTEKAFTTLYNNGQTMNFPQSLVKCPLLFFAKSFPVIVSKSTLENSKSWLEHFLQHFK